MTELIFDVSGEGWIHAITAMKITKNEDGTFNVKFFIYWNHKRHEYTHFCYENVPQNKVFDLVTGPTFYANGTPYYCHVIDEEQLKTFINSTE